MRRPPTQANAATEPRHPLSSIEQQSETSAKSVDQPSHQGEVAMTENERILPEYQTRRVLYLIYPGFEILDMAGPASVFAAANMETGKEIYKNEVISINGGRNWVELVAIKALLIVLLLGCLAATPLPMWVKGSCFCY